MLLILDTAHEQGYMAIGRDGELVAERRLPADRRHSDTFALQVADLLQEFGFEPGEVDRIGVGVGPGSYTGIRVAVAFAKGLALATDADLVGYCSLEGYRPAGEGRWCSLFDARAGGVYLFEEGQSVERCAIEELPKRLEGVKTIVTPDLAVRGRLPSEIDCRWEEGRPDGGWLLREIDVRESAPVEIVYLNPK